MEQEAQPNGQLPIISKETVARLEEELGLNVSGTTESVLESITKERQPSFIEKIKEMTRDVAFDLVEANPKLAEALSSGIKEGHWLGTVEEARTAIIEGMALVIKAFNIQSGFDLMQRLSEINDDESINKVKDVVSKGLGEGTKYGLDPIESALKLPRISDIQIDLHRLVKKTSEANLLRGAHTRNGASVMYSVLLEFKSKLFSPQSSPPPQAPPAG